MAIKLDMSKFKKIKSDARSTELQHADGHKIVIAHKALSPQSQKELHALPFCEGGDVPSYDDGGSVSNTPITDRLSYSQSAPSSNSSSSSSTPSRPIVDPAKAKLFASGFKKATNYAQGGETKDPTQRHLLPGDKQWNKIEKQVVDKALVKMADGGEVPNSSSEPDNTDLAGVVAGKPVDKSSAEPTTTLDMFGNPAAIPSDNSQAADQATPSPAPGPQPQALNVPQDLQPKAPSQPTPSLDQSSDLDKAVNQQEAGIQQTAKAQGQLGDEQAETNLKAASQAQQIQRTYDFAKQEIDDHVDNTLKDIANGQINPHQLMDNMSTFDKVKTGIGLILGGLGSGLTGGENPVLKMLNANIERDIDAQKANLGKKQNLLGAYYQQYGNLKDATDMALITNKMVAAHELDAAAAHAQDPLAKAAALKASGELKQSVIPLQQQFQMRQTLAKLSAGGQDNMGQQLAYLRAINPEAAKVAEEHYVPGVGTSDTPVPEAVKQQIVATKNVNDLMNKSLNFAKQPIPNPVSDPAGYAKFQSEGSTLQQQLIGSVKQAQHDGVYKESEAEFLLKQIGDSPASMMRSVTTIPKLKQLQQIKQSEFDNLTKTYGIHGNTQLPNDQQSKLQSLSPELQSMAKLAMANPNNPKAKAFIQKYLQ